MSVNLRIVDNELRLVEPFDVSFFGDAEKRRIEGITNAKRKGESVAALRVLKELLPINAEREISRDENGRPSFCGKKDEDFNISHSASLTAVAYVNKKGCRVGIDIEEIKEGRDEKLYRIAERYFTEKEKALLEKGESSRGFYKIWTAKEAKAKMLGIGLSKMLSSENDSKKEDEIPLFFSHHLVTYREKVYVMTICTNENCRVEFVCDKEIYISNF